MTAAVTLGGTFGPGTRWGYREAGSGHWVLVTTPAADPARWQEFLAGAERVYAAHGVERVLGLDEIRLGGTTSLFFLVLSAEGETVAGARVHGPIARPDEAHAVAEWQGEAGQTALRSVLNRLVPEGVVEMKAGWVAQDRPFHRELAQCVARSPIHAATLLGTRYAVATAGQFAISGWIASGGTIQTEVPPVAYPDARYSTQLVCWDRRNLPTHLVESERCALDDETAQLRVPLLPAQVAR